MCAETFKGDGVSPAVKETCGLPEPPKVDAKGNGTKPRKGKGKHREGLSGRRRASVPLKAGLLCLPQVRGRAPGVCVVWTTLTCRSRLVLLTLLSFLGTLGGWGSISAQGRV